MTAIVVAIALASTMLPTAPETGVRRADRGLSEGMTSRIWSTVVPGPTAVVVLDMVVDDGALSGLDGVMLGAAELCALTAATTAAKIT